MDGMSFSLHAPEPGHLAFGKLVDGGIQFLKHLFVGEVPCQIIGHMPVFEPVETKLCGLQPSLKQPSYFIHHAIPEPDFQPFRDPLPQLTAFEMDGEDDRFDWWKGRLFVGMRLLVAGDLYGPDQAVFVCGIRGIVEGFHPGKHVGQCVHGHLLQLFTQMGVFRHPDEAVPADGCIHI